MTDDRFTGFPPEGLQFLSDLAANNRREWFEAHRAVYEKALLAPAVAFVAAVGDGLRQIAPRINVDTRTNGAGSLMRIYRDVRFSPDKTPYKTTVDALFWEGNGRKTGRPAFGFRLTAGGLGLMAGLFAFSREQLERYRAAVIDGDLGPRLAAAAAAVEKAGPYGIGGREYKRVPSGFDGDHPRAGWLRHKGLWAYTREEIPAARLHDAALVEQVLDHYRRMAPVERWLAAVLA